MTASADIRASLDHPIIDSDGHMLEIVAAATPFLRKHISSDPYDEWRSSGSIVGRNAAPRTLEQRRQTRDPQGAWWGTHTVDVLERATATLPELMHQRMDEFGIDVSVLYPTNTLTTCAIDNEEVRRGACAGYNEFFSELYGPYADRLRPAGMIPMHTPAEAIAEIEHCRDLGLTVIALPEGVLRPMATPAGPGSSAWLYPGQAHWFDTYGLDSEHDYDPVWSAAARNGFAVTFHGGLAVRPGVCTSISSYVANHVGMFAALMYPLCKALYLGGVTKRHPNVPFVFLEADDRGTSTAFGPEKEYGRSVKAVFSSDIGHWDVVNSARVVEESYELVEHGHLSPDQYRAFVCDNPIDMFTRANPGFFSGTPVEPYVGQTQ